MNRTVYIVHKRTNLFKMLIASETEHTIAGEVQKIIVGDAYVINTRGRKTYKTGMAIFDTLEEAVNYFTNANKSGIENMRRQIEIIERNIATAQAYKEVEDADR